jgi:hypothetical protein
MCYNGSFPRKICKEVLDFHKNELEALGYKDVVLYIIPHLQSGETFKYSIEIKVDCFYDITDMHMVGANPGYDLIYVKSVSDLFKSPIFLLSDIETNGSYLEYMRSIFAQYAEVVGL